MTKLGAALRHKFKTPQAAMKKLGLDAALLAEEEEMPKRSRRAAMAQDQDLDEVIQALVPLIDVLNGNGGGTDQTVTEPSGSIPANVDWDRAMDALKAYDARVRYHTRAADAARRLGRDETEEERDKREGEDAAYDQRVGLMPHLRGGRDQVPPQFLKEKEEGEDQGGGGSAEVSRQNLPPAQPDLITKSTMDEAIRVALDAARETWIQQQRDIREAEREVRPLIGDLAIAYDSAAAVRAAALRPYVKDVDKIDPSAYSALIAQIKQLKTSRAQTPYVAQDSASAKSLAERFPGIDKIGRA